MEKHDEIGGEKDKLYYLKERQKISRFISDRKSLILLVILFLPLLFLVARYRYSLPVESNVVSSSTIETDQSNKKDEAEITKEREEKLGAVTKIFGDYNIIFAGQTLNFRHFSDQGNDVLVTYYSSDILDYSAENRVTIYQYGNKMAASDLLKKELLDVTRGLQDSQPIQTIERNNAHFIAYTWHDSDYTYASLSLVEIFEKDGKTYKILYEKEVHEDVLEKSHSWVDKEYLGFIDYFKDIDLSFSEKVLNDSLSIRNNLSKSNFYNGIKWETRVVEESTPYADVKLKYPEFKGFSSVYNLNRTIKDFVLGTLKEDRKFVEDLKKDDKNSYTDEKGNVFSDCFGNQDYFYSCSVNLKSSFEISPVINDIISVEIVITDYTGGGAGNHSYIKTIIYDLKNNRELSLDSLFCGPYYANTLVEILKANLLTDPVHERDLEKLGNEVLFSDLSEVSFSNIGITLFFQPYTFAPGAAGIYSVFVPYYSLKNSVCFNGYGNNIITIKRNLLNLEVPAKLSDSCGFMAGDCEGFSFYEGEFNKIDSYDFDREKPYMSILSGDYKIGTLINNGKNEQIVVAPYYWVWASSGSGMYVLKLEKDKLALLARIDSGKSIPKNIEIKNNKIYFASVEYGRLEYKDSSCYFTGNMINESSFKCD